ncbi:phosphate ABC transporter permease PstA [Pokkaliibacter sp. CJK22405]|uniref:phosphate ABC transporter permease PstA n=1 Tax=Pokkaliibacter sp. CJK22405 TaxID=3384615 RepID=UPI003984B727
MARSELLVRSPFRRWQKRGSAWVWLNALAVALCLLMMFGLLGTLVVRGTAHFWPAPVMVATYQNEQGQTETLSGVKTDEEAVSRDILAAAGVPLPVGQADQPLHRWLIKVGNRELQDGDFRWVLAEQLDHIRYPAQLWTIERRNWGTFYGTPVSLSQYGKSVRRFDNAHTEVFWQQFQERLMRARALYDRAQTLQQQELGSLNTALEANRLEQRRLKLKGDLSVALEDSLGRERDRLQQRYQQGQQQLESLYQQSQSDALLVTTADGRLVSLPLSEMLRVSRTNAMTLTEKWQDMGARMWDFVSGQPREGTSEGGVFPAIVGTVILVLLMTVIVTPLGVMTAVYLHEYAGRGWLTRMLRIAVHNLAGVPSIVYGVFGLGFFVYFLGGKLDQLFFPEALPSPTFGTPGLLWASLTLALLTLPVVIVATEEGLARIPRSLREGSLALGATRWETLWRVTLPMATPAMMTGIMLAVARAAGEVAPLMLVGVVKLAPSLPVDSHFPYVHLEQQFMHLGFQIYDMALQSPNVEAARPLVYATALLLVLVIGVLNLAAVALRHHLRERYRILEW